MIFLKDLKTEDVKIGMKVYGRYCQLFGTIVESHYYDNQLLIRIEWYDFHECNFLGELHPYKGFSNTIIIDNNYFFISTKR